MSIQPMDISVFEEFNRARARHERFLERKGNTIYKKALSEAPILRELPGLHPVHSRAIGSFLNGMNPQTHTRNHTVRTGKTVWTVEADMPHGPGYAVLSRIRVMETGQLKGEKAGFCEPMGRTRDGKRVYREYRWIRLSDLADMLRHPDRENAHVTIENLFSNEERTGKAETALEKLDTVTATEKKNVLNTWKGRIETLREIAKTGGKAEVNRYHLALVAYSKVMADVTGFIRAERAKAKAEGSKPRAVLVKA